MKHYTLILMAALLLLVSCKNNQKPVETLTADPIDSLIREIEAEDEDIEVPDETAIRAFDFLGEVELKMPPYRDSTNFDNHHNARVLSSDEMLLLHLKDYIEDGENFTLNYRIKLGDNFHTIAVSYNIGEMELYTSLLTYSKEYEFIGILTVAYDEIAESWSRVESTIYNNRVVADNISYINDEPEVTKVEYEIEPDGEFTKVSEETDL